MTDQNNKHTEIANETGNNKPLTKSLVIDEANSKPDEAAQSVKKGGLIIGVIILLSLAAYLLADRFTPYTTQARIQGYVVGVAPKVAGVVTQVWVRNNQEVQRGEKLFQVDPSQYQIALERARGEYASALRTVGAGNAAVDGARANLLASKANEIKAQQDIKRLEKLYREDAGTISVRRLEVSRATLDQARAQVSSAEAAVQQAIEQKGGDNDAENTILKTALNSVEKAELDFSNTTITASSRGVITDLRADVGQFAGAGSPVMTLVAIHDVWINAEFTENNLGNLQVGSSVDILFDVLPGQVFDGRIRSIGLGVSAGQPPAPGTLQTISNNRDWLRQSQRFPVIIEFPVDQSDILKQQLRVGGQASVIAYSEDHGVLAILGKFYIRLMSWLSYAY
jgi:multidrug resistance efflux pump